MIPVKRFSVCIPGTPPVEVLSTGSKQLALASATSDQVVYDWSTWLVVKE